MTLLASDRLAAHFTAGELTRDGATLGAFLADVTPLVASNLGQTAAALEQIRAVLGVPMRITSGFRPPEKNAAVGGAVTSNHMDGLAADFIPVDLSQYRAYKLLLASPVPAWDQIIYYPIQGHIHLGIGPRMRRETRIQLFADPGGTPLLSVGLVERLQGYAATLADVADDVTTGSNLWGIALVGMILLLILLTSRR